MCHFIIRCTSWFSVVSMFSTVGTRNSELLLEQFCVSLVHVGHSTATWIVTSQYSHSHVENVLYYFLCVVCFLFRAHLTTYYSHYTHNVLHSFFCRYIHVLTIMFSLFLFIQVISATTKTRNLFSIVDVSHRSKKASRSFEVYITS